MKKFGYVSIYVEIVNSEKNLYEIFKENIGKNLIMLESKSYFEAYYYVLK